MESLVIAGALTISLAVGFVVGGWYVPYKMAQTTLVNGRGCGGGCVHVHVDDRVPSVREVWAEHPGGRI